MTSAQATKGRGLARFSDEELLAELVRRNPPTGCPKSRSTRDVECLVGIGKSNSVWIEFFHDDLEALAREAKP